LPILVSPDLYHYRPILQITNIGQKIGSLWIRTDKVRVANYNIVLWIYALTYNYLIPRANYFFYKENSECFITFFQALTNFLNLNQDPEVLVMGNGLWSIKFKPNLTKSLEEYYLGLDRLVKVNWLNKYSVHCLMGSQIMVSIH
jgi:hypothetical protein